MFNTKKLDDMSALTLEDLFPKAGMREGIFNDQDLQPHASNISQLFRNIKVTDRGRLPEAPIRKFVKLLMEKTCSTWALSDQKDSTAGHSGYHINDGSLSKKIGGKTIRIPLEIKTAQNHGVFTKDFAPHCQGGYYLKMSSPYMVQISDCMLSYNVNVGLMVVLILGCEEYKFDPLAQDALVEQARLWSKSLELGESQTASFSAKTTMPTASWSFFLVPYYREKKYDWSEPETGQEGTNILQ